MHDGKVARAEERRGAGGHRRDEELGKAERQFTA
jgi:hypothetical protein